MDRDTLLVVTDFSRSRLLGLLDGIEKNAPNADQVLAWRPGPNRAHIAWQAMHCAATHDKYLNVNIRGDQSRDPAVVTAFGGGSTPSDENVPNLATIRSNLLLRFNEVRQYISDLNPADAQRKLANGRTVEESIVLLAWHEAHPQGQIH